MQPLQPARRRVGTDFTSCCTVARQGTHAGWAGRHQRHVSLVSTAFALTSALGTGRCPSPRRLVARDRGGGYIRRIATKVRTPNDASIQTQRETCTRLANQHGYEIVAEFVDENVSGAIAIDKRAALKRALRALADDQADRLH
jgi:Resolvase, N terminal domain